jgi:hypothetical protein
MATRFAKESKREFIYLEEEEIDEVKALLVYILMKDSLLDREDIYSSIFGGGKRITWH